MTTMEPKAKKSRTNALDEQINRESLGDNTTMETLNNDCLLQIFEYLPISDRIRLERVNKTWRSVSLASWRNFKNLDFTRDTWGHFDRTKVTTGTLKKVLDRCGQFVTSLDMTDYHILLQNVNAETIMKKCHNLTSINLSSFKVNTKLLRTMTISCTKVEKLTIAECCRTVNDQFIESTVLPNYQNLKVLKFKNHKLVGHCLQAVNSNIEELHFENCNELFMKFLRNVIPTFQKLRVLSLPGSFDYCCPQHFSLSFINFTNIKVLDISKNVEYVDDSCLIEIADSCRNLQCLDLSYNYKVTDDGLSAMTLLNLEHLRINFLWYVTGSSLTNLPSLKSLSCRDCFNLDEIHLDSIFKTSISLKFLDLSNCTKIDAMFEIVIRADGIFAQVV